MSKPKPTTLRVHALAPLLFRDARPFGAADGDETRARSLPLPLPGTLAGFTRTLVGDTLGWDWKNTQSIKDAKSIALDGFLLHRETEKKKGYVVPAPRDAVVMPVETQNAQGVKEVVKDADGKPVLRTMAMRPLALEEGEGVSIPKGKESEGNDTPDTSLAHLLPLSIDSSSKPERGYDL